MDEIFKIIFGDFTLLQLFGYVWFFIIGYVIYGLTETSNRDVNSLNTPKKWNWKFWFHDNWRRYLTTFLCSYVLFRFYNEVSGHAFAYIDAVGLGLIGDGVAAMLKSKINVFTEDRLKIMKKLEKENGEVG
jgi:hypothetical protein